MALDAGDEAAAARELVKAVEVEPDDPELWRDLARTQFRLARHEEAHSSIERSLALDPEAPASVLLRAQIRMALGDREPALADARVALETLHTASRLQELAILFLRLHELESAWTAGQLAIELSDHDPSAYANLAILAAEARADEVARRAFDQGRSLHPHDVGLAQAEAAWLVQRGELARAREAYRSMLATHPSPGLVHLALALLHHQDRQFEPALQHGKAAVEALGAQRADVHYTYVVILLDMGQTEEARAHLVDARRRFPGDAQLSQLAKRAN
jgi:tetratricopeptide (TPR) repeat protein